MQFRIADTFTASLMKLSSDEQKLVKQTTFDAQVNPASPGLQFHKLDKGQDRNFWSLRASKDIRIIVHRTPDSILFCYTDRHDKAYAWAEHRKLEIHPRTGAAQIVKVVEIEKIFTTRTRAPAPMGTGYAPFAHISDDIFLQYGVPSEWIGFIRAVPDQDSLLEIAANLPAEAGEALLDLALGRMPPLPTVGHLPENRDEVSASAFNHPDAERRFRLMGSIEELKRALEFPWEKWVVFLHPDQRALAEGKFKGAVKVCGSAGTGKTVVALHRTVCLARTNPDARVLLTTLSDPLANVLQNKINCLLAHEPKLAERINVCSLDSLAKRLFRIHANETAHGAALATSDQILEVLKNEIASLDLKGYNSTFLHAEWRELVDARQLKTWDEYRATPRLGRKTRLSELRRQAIWTLFDRVNNVLSENKLYTKSSLFTSLTSMISSLKHPLYDFVVVDEAQDLSYAQMRFIKALGAHRQDSLFFCGDLGQRIFQLPFSWKALGVDIRGRSNTLRVNYRTSHQIRSQADKLLEAEFTDADGNMETRDNPISVFNGPLPEIKSFGSLEEESEAVSAWLTALNEHSLSAREIAVFVRSEAEIPRAVSALESARLPYVILDNEMDIPKDKATVAVMHLAKGLEFCAVAVMACDSEVIPSQQRIEDLGEESDLEDVYNTERQLLYVSCTRARDFLFLSGVAPTSEFLDDL
ncbi:MAG: UvrD-helicase domain-containing protein [Synergistaceae bacterium]|nr:UvrD-helicase domain-containing protein [Synergistaceae bacterium]